MYFPFRRLQDEANRKLSVGLQIIIITVYLLIHYQIMEAIFVQRLSDYIFNHSPITLTTAVQTQA